MDWRKEWERITDHTVILHGPNPRKIKKTLQGYMRGLGRQGYSEEEIKRLVWKRFNKLKGEMTL